MTTTISTLIELASAQARIQSRAGLYRLNTSALQALCDLGASESIVMTHLARRLGISSAAITGMIDSLEKSQFVVRQNSRTDRRKIWITLTDLGRRALSDILTA
jgi:DNA-binding MarR family transcriptional regulator